MVSRSICNLKIDTIYMYDIPFDRSFLQLSNGIRHVMPSTDTKPELTAKASMAQPVSQPAVYANGLISVGSCYLLCVLAIHVCTVSSCVWVHDSVEILRPLFLLRNNISTGTGSLHHHRPKHSWIQCTHVLPTHTINSRSQQILQCYN
jgi:hypothetical protein